MYIYLLTIQAEEQLLSIKDKRIQSKVIERIKKLSQDPEKQGKPLVDEMAGYRSIRVVGQRYRIIYRIEKEEVIVVVVSIGLRKDGDKKDVYRLAQKLLKAGLLEP